MVVYFSPTNSAAWAKGKVVGKLDLTRSGGLPGDSNEEREIRELIIYESNCKESKLAKDRSEDWKGVRNNVKIKESLLLP